MKEELKRREYCKTTSLTKSLIAFVVCLVCFVFFLFWSPSRELAKKDVKIVLKEDCNKWIYVWSGESGKLEETNETLKAGTSLKGIAEDGRWTWIVEDENGNRFGVPKLAVEGEVKELRAMNLWSRFIDRFLIRTYTQRSRRLFDGRCIDTQLLFSASCAGQRGRKNERSVTHGR